MIVREEVFTLILEACPLFAPAWREFCEEWGDEKDLPLYLASADLARHLISLLAAGDTATFAAVFGVVERLHREGDPYVKELATVGILEDIQNGNLHKTTEPEQFRPYLRPESERWWDKLYAFWEEGKLLTDD